MLKELLLLSGVGDMAWHVGHRLSDSSFASQLVVGPCLNCLDCLDGVQGEVRVVAEPSSGRAHGSTGRGIMCSGLSLAVIEVGHSFVPKFEAVAHPRFQPISILSTQLYHVAVGCLHDTMHEHHGQVCAEIKKSKEQYITTFQNKACRNTGVKGGISLAIAPVSLSNVE